MELNGKKPVTSNELTIQQLTVEIKTIRVGNRQVSQSLFRQLPTRSIIDPYTGALQGTPWCFINYFWNDCGTEGKHQHLVWQQGDKIFRDCLCDSSRYMFEDYRNERDNGPRIAGVDALLLESHHACIDVYVLGRLCAAYRATLARPEPAPKCYLAYHGDTRKRYGGAVVDYVLDRFTATIDGTTYTLPIPRRYYVCRGYDECYQA